MSKGRKTRQEKIIADLRRKLEARQSQSRQALADSFKIAHQTEPQQINPQTETISLKNLSNSPSGTPTPPSTISNVYIKRDLTKTLVLAILAISLEVVLFFLLG